MFGSVVGDFRRACTALALVAWGLAPWSGAHAQESYTSEVRIEGGMWVPTGRLGEDLGSAPMIGVSGRYIVWRGFSLTASGWVSSPTDKIQPASCACPALVQPYAQRVTIKHADLGIEWGRRVTSIGGWTMLSSIGAAVGGRTYAPENPTEAQLSAVDWVGSLDLAVVHHQVAVRIEARDYVSTWYGLLGNEQVGANDLTLQAGLAWRW